MYSYEHVCVYKRSFRERFKRVPHILVVILYEHVDKIQDSLFYLMNFDSIQLSDFGLAITGGINGKNIVKLSGTLGYVAPEYLLDGIQSFVF